MSGSAAPRVLAFGTAVGLWVMFCAGCSGTSTPIHDCTVDDDCPTGAYCGAAACRVDCRVDRDCVDRGGAFRCSPRGECVGSADAGIDATVTPQCTADAQCDDGVYCTGAEVCTPGAPHADARGCVQVPTGCTPAECDEATHACDPCRSADDDHDGYDDVRCGGADCDDSNPNIGPGRGELCDPGGVDEDCNPATLGSRAEDQDGDGFWPAANSAGTPCCNGAGCGTDCDNTRSDVNPGVTESCNGVDENCNGNDDEGYVRLCADTDSDGYGDNSTCAGRCPGTLGYVADDRDCCDHDAEAHPGATAFQTRPRTVCGGYDFDCNAAEELQYPLWDHSACPAFNCCADPGPGEGWIRTALEGPVCGRESSFHECYVDALCAFSCTVRCSCYDGGSPPRLAACR